MKRASLLILALAVVLTFNSCKKDENGNIVVASLSVKKDGTLWNSLVRQTSVTANPTSTSGGKLIAITATNGANITSGELLNITILGTDLKEYKLQTLLTSNTPISTECTFTFKASAGDSDATKIYAGVVGSVTLTKYNESSKLVSGTFKFTTMQGGDATKKIEFTEGKFENLTITL